MKNGIKIAALLALVLSALAFANLHFQATKLTGPLGKQLRHDLNMKFEEDEFIPNECQDFRVKKFPTLTSLLEQGKDSSMGAKGGEWSACTHIKLYGMNFASFFARHLAYGLKPKSVLEFGCGLGTTSDFLARFVPGGSKVVCVEPEAMLGEVFGGEEGAEEGFAQRFPNRPLQLSMLSFDPEARKCSDALYNPNMEFELILSLEVAEHVPPEFTDELIQRLATVTTKYILYLQQLDRDKVELGTLMNLCMTVRGGLSALRMQIVVLVQES